MNATSSTATFTNPTWTSDEQRLESFGRALDKIARDAKAAVGPEDLRYIQRIDRISHSAGILGRALLALPLGPLSWGAGVFALWVHKQLQATEIGHAALHGAYNRIEGAEHYHSKHYRWKVPIDEQSWVRGHNGRHHGLTNVAGDDPDVHFGPVRLTPETPHRVTHYFQLPFTFLILLPNFLPLMNLHFTGVSDVWSGNGREDEFDFIKDRSPASVRAAYKAALRKYLPYYAREYLLWPGLSALFMGLSPLVFTKVALGNLAAEKLRNIYSGLTIICGHVGEETASYEEGTRPSCKGERYAMQVEATNNFRVPWLVSLFCGALDKQIEHHLFPTLPTNRLREIAPRVEAACAAHGVEYRQRSWPRTLLGAFKSIARLSLPDRPARQPSLASPLASHPA